MKPRSFQKAVLSWGMPLPDESGLSFQSSSPTIRQETVTMARLAGMNTGRGIRDRRTMPLSNTNWIQSMNATAERPETTPMTAAEISLEAFSGRRRNRLRMLSGFMFPPVFVSGGTYRGRTRSGRHTLTPKRPEGGQAARAPRHDHAGENAAAR
ncbi:MAG: hypothetical protein BWY99_02678 [Synergistetes bacterium ADurb.BinA166]|nr:MAG: hypothetical protein BWY99_02678 [Synergistetes bacterium ADurb.BinA166]